LVFPRFAAAHSLFAPCVPPKIIERREAQLQMDIRSLHDQMQIERERSQGLQDSTGALERRIAELEKENAELMEEYRTTLQLLPGFQPDNPWVL
jgi:septal ring factor EnvC (AmiA/AmiB activator)